MELPELGVGIVYSPGLEPLLEAAQSMLDVIEIEPQPFWYRSTSADCPYRIDSEFLERLAGYPQRKLIHSVGFPVGGSAAAAPKELVLLRQTIEAVGAPWASEHLSFNRVCRKEGGFCAGFLLPPVQTGESVQVSAANISRMAAFLGVPVAFETGVNYLRPFPGELSDGTFFRLVAQRADCGILLDLHNLWANARNGRQPVLDVIAELPLERVWEVHLGGGESFRDYWLDAHSDLVPPALMELAENIVPRLPNLKALLFEIMADYVWAKQLRTADLLDQIRSLRNIWDLRIRHTGFAGQPRPLTITLTSEPSLRLPSSEEWEYVLGKLVIGSEPAGALGSELLEDSGIQIYRHLVESVRAGMIVTALTLTSRLLMLHVGEAGFRAVLRDFWANAPPELHASDEAHRLGVYLKTRQLGIPHLEEVLEFELSAQEVLIDGTARTVRFSREPMRLLAALGEGRLPEAEGFDLHELTIKPSPKPIT
jgi:uncharacterized protein (UPF0276 family)